MTRSEGISPSVLYNCVMAENETTSNDTSLGFVIGIVWSVLTIAVPAVLWALGIMETIMIGAVVGATIRFGSDMLLTALQLRTDTNPSTVGQQHPISTVMIVGVQFGTLLIGLWLLFIAGQVVGLGIAGIMLLTYAFGSVLDYVLGDDVGNTKSDEIEKEDDSEWKFDVDDV